ncbi:MAG TPA: TetR/AcrR family transcriptional regulator [Spirochaetia bacterium]|nr:TetR/AcrR family transcriptional regulator [Spirochaetia bacterium]
MSRKTDPVKTQTILRAAQRRFLQWGYSGTSIAQLAEDLGITKAALYYHFPDKEALFLAVVQAYLGEVAAELAGLSPLFQGDDPGEALRALANLFLCRHESTTQMQQLSLQESRHLSPEGQRTLAMRFHEEMVRPVSGLLQRAVDHGWLRSAAVDEPALIWTFLGLLTAFLQPGHETSQEQGSASAFVRLLLRGLSPENPTPSQGAIRA